MFPTWVPVVTCEQKETAGENENTSIIAERLAKAII